MKFKFIYFFILFSVNSYGQLYTNTELDSIAKNIPESYNVSTKSIADYFKSISKDDRDLSRMIFSWVAFHIKYDDYSFNNSIYKSPEADSVLKYRTAVCAGYSYIFKAICEHANLEAVSIDGFAKGYGFKKGMSVDGINHSWNAVKYNNKWHLMDATWGSGSAESVNGKAVSISKFCDYYFDVPPLQFIFNHFPDSSHYQFLEKKVTKDQFKNLIYVTPNLVFPLGFNADTIISKSLKDSKFNLPDVFSIDKTEFTLLKMPYSRVLKAKSSCVFQIQNNSAQRVVLINNNELMEFEKVGENLFELKLSDLKAGRILIGIAGEPNVDIVLSYDVI